jgi:hypothetical protein
MIEHVAGWYLTLLQVRGARWFQGLVRLQAQRPDKTTWRVAQARLSSLLDTLQGPCAPVIGLIFYVILLTGAMTRAWYYTTLTMLSVCCGFRAFVTIVRARVSDLRRVARLQNEIRGTQEDKRRRKLILKRKAYALAFDMIGVFLLAVAARGSEVVFQSNFSSRQLAIHFFVMLPQMCMVEFGILSYLIRGVHRSKMKRQSASIVTETKSVASGMSAVTPTIVEASQR